MDAAEVGKSLEVRLHSTYLQALLAAKVPVDQIILQAEAMGSSPGELEQLAERLLPCSRAHQSRLVSVCLPLGVTRNWKPFVPEGRQLGLALIAPLIWQDCKDLDPLVAAIGAERWKPFCRKALCRLGYPLILINHIPGGRNLPDGCNPVGVLPWLEAGMGIVAEGIELKDYASSSQGWGRIIVDELVLRNGQGPQTLALGCTPWDSRFCPDIGPSARLFQVKSLHEVSGLQEIDVLVAVDCPDLIRLDATPPFLVLKDCPELWEIPVIDRSNLLHLERCPRFRSIGQEQTWDMNTRAASGSTFCTLVLSECPSLNALPARMKVLGRMILHRMGPIRRWPSNLQVGGDLHIQDCAEIEELPALEVSGSLRVEGISGIRRLASGSVIGRHLDLRTCEFLEEIPRGVKVGGCLYLPPHLTG